MDNWQKRATAIVTEFTKQAEEIKTTEEELAKIREDSIRLQNLSNKAVSQYQYLNDNLNTLSNEQVELEQQLDAIEQYYDHLLATKGVPQGDGSSLSRDTIYELTEELFGKTCALDTHITSLRENVTGETGPGNNPLHSLVDIENEV